VKLHGSDRHEAHPGHWSKRQ